MIQQFIILKCKETQVINYFCTMYYPENFEHKIGFDRIREIIKSKCFSIPGREFVDKIRFSTNIRIIKKLHDQSSEFVNVVTSKGVFPSTEFADMRPILAELQTPGSYILTDALFELKHTLVSLIEIVAFFENLEQEEYPELTYLASRITVDSILLEKTNSIIDEKGEIKDSASATLHSIRRNIASKQNKAIKETRKAFEHAKKMGYIPDNSEITIRNERSVIPLKSSNKRAIGGIIHDESSTGQTVFVEAPASFEINNEIIELENEERREIIKILTDFTNFLRPVIPDILEGQRTLGIFDFIKAKAQTAILLNSHQPVLNSSKKIEIKNAVHPLLFLSLKEQNKKVIPLDIELNKEQRIVLISGPNAGGKSVCLKTVGLLQYMLQCGLLIPVSPDSLFHIFSRLFIDIGDEQSIENDLSTYSSHLHNMKFFLNNSNGNTLFLIDEFGTGTEPQFGGAIAEATLEQLNNNKAFGVITTHYSNLKLAAEKLPGLINAAMLFDSKKLQPLYNLQVGKPGSSFTFEIAEKIGFPGEVLNRARKKSGSKYVKFDRQLQQLEIEKLNLEKQKQKIDSTDSNLSLLMEKYNSLVSDLEKSKKQIIKEAREQAAGIIDDSNKVVEKTIREIKEAAAEKEKTKELREQLNKKKDELKKVEPKPKRKRTVKETISTFPGVPVKVGDFVKIENTDTVGELISLVKDDAIISVNDLKVTTSAKKLIKSSAPATKPKSKRSYLSIVNDINQKAATFNLSLDLRGKRADEAMSLLQKYIDEALLLNIREVSILHGKGWGILREIIREYLLSVDEIEKFGDAPIDMGGAGITRVYFHF